MIMQNAFRLHYDSFPEELQLNFHGVVNSLEC